MAPDSLHYFENNSRSFESKSGNFEAGKRYDFDALGRQRQEQVSRMDMRELQRTIEDLRGTEAGECVRIREWMVESGY